MMALMLGVLETYEPSCIGRPARFFFMLEGHGPQITAGRVAAPEPSRQRGRVWSLGTRGSTGALPSREAGSRAIGLVAALEPTLAGRQGPVLQGTWMHAPLLVFT
jgi:hypothetical protein